MNRKCNSVSLIIGFGEDMTFLLRSLKQGSYSRTAIDNLIQEITFAWKLNCKPILAQKHLWTFSTSDSPPWSQSSGKRSDWSEFPANLIFLRRGRDGQVLEGTALDSTWALADIQPRPLFISALCCLSILKYFSIQESEYPYSYSWQVWLISTPVHCTPLFRFDQTHLDSGWDLKHWNQTQGLNQLPGFPRREKTRSEVIGRWRCDTWLKKTRPTCICLIFQIGWGFPQNKDHPISFFIAAVNSHILTRGAGKYIRGGCIYADSRPGINFAVCQPELMFSHYIWISTLMTSNLKVAYVPGKHFTFRIWVLFG